MFIQFGDVTASGGGFSVEIEFSASTPFFGFQFEYTGPEPSSAAGGAAEDAGFSIQIGNVILGFSLSLSAIPANDGFDTLTVLAFSDDDSDEEFCVIPASSIIAGDEGSSIVFEFVGDNCVILESDDDDCPTAGACDRAAGAYRLLACQRRGRANE